MEHLREMANLYLREIANLYILLMRCRELLAVV